MRPEIRPRQAADVRVARVFADTRPRRLRRAPPAPAAERSGPVQKGLAPQGNVADHVVATGTVDHGALPLGRSPPWPTSAPSASTSRRPTLDDLRERLRRTRWSAGDPRPGLVPGRPGRLSAGTSPPTGPTATTGGGGGAGSTSCRSSSPTSTGQRPLRPRPLGEPRRDPAAAHATTGRPRSSRSSRWSSRCRADFHLVLTNSPGVAFSGPLTGPGWNTAQIAGAFVRADGPARLRPVRRAGHGRRRRDRRGDGPPGPRPRRRRPRQRPRHVPHPTTRPTSTISPRPSRSGSPGCSTSATTRWASTPSSPPARRPSPTACTTPRSASSPGSWRSSRSGPTRPPTCPRTPSTATCC